MAEGERARADADAVAIENQRGLGDAAAIQERAVPAAEIDQPILPRGLRADDGVLARCALVGEHDLIGGRAPEGAGADDGETFSGRVLEPSI